MTLPQEEYTIRVRARWIMIVGDPDGQYMVADVGDWGPWASSGPEADGPAPAAAGSGKVELTFPDNGVSVSSKRIYRRMQSSMPIQWRRKACSAPILTGSPAARAFIGL